MFETRDPLATLVVALGELKIGPAASAAVTVTGSGACENAD